MCVRVCVCVCVCVCECVCVYIYTYMCICRGKGVKVGGFYFYNMYLRMYDIVHMRDTIEKELIDEHLTR